MFYLGLRRVELLQLEFELCDLHTLLVLLILQCDLPLLLGLGLIRQVLLLPRQLLMLEIKPLQLELRLRFHLLEVITLGKDLLLQDQTRLSLLPDGLVQEVVPLSYLLNQFLLSVRELVGQLEGLLVTELKVALVAHEVLSLVVLGKSPLVLSALVADSACASLAVMATLFREGTELLG